MSYFIMLILAVCAVRCDDSSYYVIQVQEDKVSSATRPAKPFKVYWNVPTMQCGSKKIPFEGLHQKYGIIQNEDDRFRGEKIAILYDPGIFPALLENETSGDLIFRNGGVPQEGDLERHLAAFAEFMEQSVLKDFSGVGIIDFESWRPIYRQNFGVLTPYKDVSYEIERKRHWWWTKSWIQAEAMARFEKAGKEFMHKTLILAKKVRPNALWGYYAYPYCFNMAGNHFDESCAKNVPRENDRLSWLWSASTALYPSVYSSKSLTTQQLQQLIRGRIKEALRVNVNNVPILPYFWFKYRDGGFLSQKDLEAALETLYRSKASGIIIWGSSNDVNTKVKCQNLLSYLNDTLGPAISKYTKRNKVPLHDEVDGSEINNIVNNSDPITTINPNPTESVLDPEIDWDPPENNSQNTIQSVQNGFDMDANLTSNKSQLNNESAILDRRKSEGNSFNYLNLTQVQIENELKDSPNMLHNNSNADVIDENKLSSNMYYNYLNNNSLNCSTLNGIINNNFCDNNYSDGINKKSVLNSDTDRNVINVTTEEIIGKVENDLIFTTEISFQTDTSTLFVDTSLNISFVSENNSSTTFSTKEKKTSDNLRQNEIENKLINEYNMLHKNEKKGYAIKTRVNEIQNAMNYEKDTQYVPVNYVTTIASGEVQHQNNLNTESDETFFSTTEQYLEHKNNLRHSKNRKKGRRRHLTYHTTKITTPQDATTDSNTVTPTYTTDMKSNDLSISESTTPPQTYQQRETMNTEKIDNDMETHINEETDEPQISNYLNHVKGKLKRTTNSETVIPDQSPITTDQVAGSSTTLFHVFGYKFHMCYFLSLLSITKVFV